MRVVRTPLTTRLTLTPDAVRAAIDRDTIMLVGSAPAYPFGLVDPIEELGELALEHELWLHVDACVGGFIAPFARRLDSTIRPFDFAVPGVRSGSASELTSQPASSIRPASGWSIPLTRFSRVDLPEPLRPVIATDSPLSTSSSAPSSTR